jgi:hypothetical protein
MCEAFALNGAEVVLLHPYRHQADPRLVGRTVFDYYGIKPIFQVQTLKNLDVVVLNRFIPDRIFTPIFFAHAFIWGYYAASVARQFRADLYYTRDATIAYWLVRMGLPTVYEAHVAPNRGQKWLLRKITRQSFAAFSCRSDFLPPTEVSGHGLLIRSGHRAAGWRGFGPI